MNSMSTVNDAQTGQPASSSLGLRDIVAGLFNRKWLIILTLLTSVTATGVFAWLTPEKYDSRMKFYIKNVRVEVSKQSEFIDVGFDHPDPAIAAAVANDVMQEGLKYFADVRVQTMKDSVQQVSHDLRSARGIHGDDVAGAAAGRVARDRINDGRKLRLRGKVGGFQVIAKVELILIVAN